MYICFHRLPMQGASSRDMTDQNKCPQRLTTASRAVSKQILHSSIRSSCLSSSPPASPPGDDVLARASLVSAITPSFLTHRTVCVATNPRRTENYKSYRDRHKWRLGCDTTNFQFKRCVIGHKDRYNHSPLGKSRKVRKLNEADLRRTWLGKFIKINKSQ